MRSGVSGVGGGTKRDTDSLRWRVSQGQFRRHHSPTNRQAGEGPSSGERSNGELQRSTEPPGHGPNQRHAHPARPCPRIHPGCGRMGPRWPLLGRGRNWPTPTVRQVCTRPTWVLACPCGGNYDNPSWTKVCGLSSERSGPGPSRPVVAGSWAPGWEVRSSVGSPWQVSSPTSTLDDRARSLESVSGSLKNHCPVREPTALHPPPLWPWCHPSRLVLLPSCRFFLCFQHCEGCCPTPRMMQAWRPPVGIRP